MEGHSQRVSDAYLDSSVIVAIALNEPGSGDLTIRLDGFSRLISANLLEAELYSTLSREGVELNDNLVSGVRWIHPNRSLRDEMALALAAGYLRGADLWHMAVTLYAARKTDELTFFTLDIRQRNVAATLGFRT